MNPLQKKCVIATAGFHLLLLAILFLGPAFFWSKKPAPDNTPILLAISLPTDTLTSGSAQSTPPPPQAQPQPTPMPPTPPPQAVVTPPPTPVPQPVQQPVEPPVQEPVHHVEPKPDDTPTPDEKPSDDPVPAPKHTSKPKPKTPDIQVDLTQVVVSKPKTRPNTAAHDRAEIQAQERADRAADRKRALALSRLTSGLRDNLSSSTDVEMPGNSSQSYSNYGQIVKSIYESAWIPPSNADNDEANPKVHVVIARDGTVISAEIIEPSGDAAVDASVRRVLDRVTFIRPFPDGAKEEKRSYNINFNLKAKRMLG